MLQFFFLHFNAVFRSSQSESPLSELMSVAPLLKYFFSWCTGIHVLIMFPFISCNCQFPFTVLEATLYGSANCFSIPFPPPFFEHFVTIASFQYF